MYVFVLVCVKYCLCMVAVYVHVDAWYVFVNFKYLLRMLFIQASACYTQYALHAYALYALHVCLHNGIFHG